MVVLLTGASGFIGRHLAQALSTRGHEVVCALRSPEHSSVTGCARFVAADFTVDCRLEDWVPRLAGVDVVINAVGILRESGRQTFESLHVQAPRALFAACATAGVRRIVQISALGADEQARSAYHLSKRRADEFLSSLPMEWVIVQPSLVYGPGGMSARLLTALASLPWIPVPGRGEQRVQPVHIEDLVAGVLALLESPTGWRSRLAFVGPRPLALADLLGRLRAGMGLGRPRLLPVPLPLVRAAAKLGRRASASLLDPDTLGMLVRGNTGDPEPLQRLLGRSARAAEAFIPRAEAETVRTAARLQWLLPLLRASIALVWLVTGVLSLGLYPPAASYALLARVGIGGALAPVMLYGAAALDLAFGVATLLLPRRRLLWLAQIAVILLYTAIITLRMPEFWLHPFGPLLKNLPMLAGILVLQQLERR